MAEVIKGLFRTAPGQVDQFFVPAIKYFLDIIEDNYVSPREASKMFEVIGEATSASP